ncbi:protein of unknown function [Methylocaldum szegediense]|uniref:Uncharacterized protein n=1 Tax=Methylocaldum szegediense TaxID=73780 RepID=A0ABM9I990_9GAMM|nr:protein of unknown function [Methylocaldum szegediense]
MDRAQGVCAGLVGRRADRCDIAADLADERRKRIAGLKNAEFEIPIVCHVRPLPELSLRMEWLGVPETLDEATCFLALYACLRRSQRLANRQKWA